MVKPATDLPTKQTRVSRRKSSIPAPSKSRSTSSIQDNASAGPSPSLVSAALKKRKILSNKEQNKKRMTTKQRLSRSSLPSSLNGVNSCSIKSRATIDVNEDKENTCNGNTNRTEPCEKVKPSQPAVYSPPPSTPPRATPYWVVQKEGRKSSPRLTRSATKRKKGERMSISCMESHTPTIVESVAMEDGYSSEGRSSDERGPTVLSFSPPDHAANAKREEAEIERREHERSKRIAEAQSAGQLLTFSPPQKKQKSGIYNYKKNTHNKISNKKTEVFLELTPGGSRKTSIMEKVSLDCSFDIAAFASEEENENDDEPKCTQEELLKAEGHIAELEEENIKLKENAIAAKKEQDDIKGIQEDLVVAKKSIQEQLAIAQEKNKELDAKLKMKDDSAKKDDEAIANLQESAKGTLELYQSTVKTLREEINEKTGQHAIFQQRTKTVEDELQKSKAEMNEIMSQLTQSKQEAKMLLAKLCMERNKANSETQAVQGGMKKELALSEAKSVGFALKLQGITSENKELREKCTILEDKCSKMEHTFLDKDAELANLHSTYEEKLDGMSSKAETNGKLKSLSEKVQMKDITITELTGKTSNLEKEVQSLQDELKSLQEKNADLAKSEEKCTASLAELSTQLDSKKKEIDQLSDARDRAEAKHLEASSALMNANRCSEKEKQRAELFEQELKALNDELDTTTNELAEAIADRDATNDRIAAFGRCEEQLLHKVSVLDESRRALHNRVMQLCGNIRVFVRVRPIIESEMDALVATAASEKSLSMAATNRGSKRKPQQVPDTDESPFRFPDMGDRNVASSSGDKGKSADDLTKTTIEALEPYKDRGGLNQRRKRWRFGFDNVFSPSHKQEDVWEATEPLIQSAIDGYNTTIFAYGQTGSGKTHTMLGDSNGEEQGLISRSVQKMFRAKKAIESASKGNAWVSISVELLEIYNENVIDLFSHSKGEGRNLKVTAKEAVGNVKCETECEDDVYEILSLAQKRRCVKATKSNAESSRSHLLFTMHFDVTCSAEEDRFRPRSSKLNICDLAGSERVGKSGSHGIVLKEAQAINNSLLVLSNVIEKLQSKSAHVPYRDSKLTKLLQDSLGGDSKTLAVVCCNPLPVHFHESLCSLRFANKVSRVELKGKEAH